MRRGAVWIGTVIASLFVAVAFFGSGISLYAAAPIGLALSSFVVDSAIQVTQMLSRIVVLDVRPDVRGRINVLYMTSIYLSGAIRSMLGVSIYYSGGWSAVAMVGMIAGLFVFLAAMAERWSGGAALDRERKTGKPQIGGD